MKMDELEGKLVLFKLSEEIRPSLSLFQIYNDELWAVVKGLDNEGVWVENPAYEMGIWWDSDGKIIPQHKQTKEKFKTNILLLWRYIKGIMSVEDERFHKVKSERFPGFQAYRAL